MFAAGGTSLHQPQGRLKALKQGGMPDTLEQRPDQAQQGRLGHAARYPPLKKSA